MRFVDRYRRDHHGMGPLMLWVVLPLLVVAVPLTVLLTGIHRRGSSREGMSVAEFGWGNMATVWLLMAAFIYLVWVPFGQAWAERARLQRLQRMGVDVDDQLRRYHWGGDMVGEHRDRERIG